MNKLKNDFLLKTLCSAIYGVLLLNSSVPVDFAI